MTSKNDCLNLWHENLLDEAHAAANAAALKAEDEATTWFPCGFAWITIGGNEPLARHCRGAIDEADPDGTQLRYGAKGHPKGWTWWCPGHRATQRLETFEAGARAFASVLRRGGIECTVGSRMD